jgi:hypothetical protein
VKEWHSLHTPCDAYGAEAFVLPDNPQASGVSACACFNLWHYRLSDTGIDIRFCGILVKSIAKPYLSQRLGAASDWRLVRLRLSLMRDPVSSIK